MQPPLLIELAQIAGVQPAFGVDGFVGLGRVAVIALHHMRAAHQHLALARAIAAGGLVVDLALGARRHRPDGCIGGAKRIGRGRGARAGLGHAETVLQGQFVESLGLALPRRVERRTAGGDIAQGRAFQFRHPALARVLHDQRVHLRHRRQDRDVLMGRSMKFRGGKAALLPHLRARADGGHQDRDEAEDMGHRQDAIDHIPRHHLPQIGRGTGAEAQVGMGQHHALGIARGAGGIKQHRHVMQIGIRAAGLWRGQMQAAEIARNLACVQPRCMGRRLGRDLAGQQNRRRGGVVDDAGDLGLALAGVDGDRHGVQLPRGIEPGHSGNAVFHHQQHAVARLHPRGPQLRRQSPTRAVQIGKAPSRAAGVAQRWCLWAGRQLLS